MTYQLDETDRRILHDLMIDARNASASAIAEGLDVAPSTVRYRIDQLEQEGVIRGYTPVIDFERVGYLTSVFMCTAPTDCREELAVVAQSIPGVMSVQVLMAGRRDLQIIAVGQTTEELREIARSLEECELEIENERLLQSEIRSPCGHFSSKKPTDSVIHEFFTPTDGTPVMELHATADAPITRNPLDVVRERGVLPESATVVSVERDGCIIRPTAETVIESGDIVTIVAPERCKEELASAFATGSPQSDTQL